MAFFNRLWLVRDQWQCSIFETVFIRRGMKCHKFIASWPIITRALVATHHPEDDIFPSIMYSGLDCFWSNSVKKIMADGCDNEIKFIEAHQIKLGFSIRVFQVQFCLERRYAWVGVLQEKQAQACLAIAHFSVLRRALAVQKGEKEIFGGSRSGRSETQGRSVSGLVHIETTTRRRIYRQEV